MKRIKSLDCIKLQLFLYLQLLNVFSNVLKIKYYKALAKISDSVHNFLCKFQLKSDLISDLSYRNDIFSIQKFEN